MKKESRTRVGSKISSKVKKIQMRPMAYIAMAFFIVIFLGSLLLYFPFTHNDGVSISYLDALFTSMSATCVTGLITIPAGVAATFNVVGVIIIAILIQIGGFGAATMAVSIFVITSRKLSFEQQSLIKESWNIDTFKGLKKIFYLILAITFTIETFGAILLFFDFWFINPEISNGNMAYAWGVSFFTSISAFNNAGFDLFGTTSLIAYQNDVYLNLVIALLITLGGLGYLVIFDIIKKKFNFKKFNFQTKVVVFMTALLFVAGTLIIFMTENLVTPNQFPQGSETMTFLGALFMNISCRTAGFTTYNLAFARNSTLIIMMILMFVGASPGGTGGGVKTTTIYVIVINFISLFTKKAPHGFNRAVSKKVISKALTIFFIYVILITASIFMVCAFEENIFYVKDGIRYETYVEGSQMFGSLDCMFDIFSAINTVGLTTGITPYLSSGSKIVLIILMFVGRIGPLSISQFLNAKEPSWTYAEGDIAIG